MPGMSRVGDTNTTGGKLLDGASTVFCNGKPVALHASLISPHAPWGNPHPPHKNAKTTDGASTVVVEGKPPVMVGSGNTCGHKIVEGSGDVFVK
jgi:uncharacterized Zn-binding protein involved in type VI secretion